MIFDETTRRWISNAMHTIYTGDLSEVQVAKTLRVISQLFEAKARQIETQMIDRVENQLFGRIED